MKVFGDVFTNIRACNLAMLVGGLFLAAGCGKQESETTIARPVLVAQASLAEDSSARVFPGRVQAIGEVRLGFEVPGYVEDILVKPGDRVAAGQPLARLDTERFTLAITQAESSVASAQAAADEALAGYTRAQTLFEREAIAPAALDHARSAAETAQAQLRGAQASLDQAHTNLRDATLLAPYDGLIAERLLETFTQVQAKQPILLLQTYDRLRVSVQVPEAYVLGLGGDRQRRRELRPRAEVQFIGHSQRIYEAVFDEVATSPDPTSLTWAVRFIMPVPEDLTVLPGMSCSVRLIGADVEQASTGVVIPLAAVVEDAQGQPAVWRIDQAQRVQRHSVVLGPTADNQVRIVEGLEAGALVVRAGQAALHEGMLVRAQEISQP